jgi:hypothetical protein
MATVYLIASENSGQMIQNQTKADIASPLATVIKHQHKIWALVPCCFSSKTYVCRSVFSSVVHSFMRKPPRLYMLRVSWSSIGQGRHLPHQSFIFILFDLALESIFQTVPCAASSIGIINQVS